MVCKKRLWRVFGETVMLEVFYLNWKVSASAFLLKPLMYIQEFSFFQSRGTKLYFYSLACLESFITILLHWAWLLKCLSLYRFHWHAKYCIAHAARAFWMHVLTSTYLTKMTFHEVVFNKFLAWYRHFMNSLTIDIVERKNNMFLNKCKTFMRREMLGKKKLENWLNIQCGNYRTCPSSCYVPAPMSL